MLHEGEKTLDKWLEWQQSLNLNEIDLSLDRINAVKEKVGFQQPDIDIFLVAGTNGKGTTVHLIESFLIKRGLNVGVYTSPHLRKYNERVTFNKRSLEDHCFLESFEKIEKQRGGIQLTYFEYGTLAAFLSLNELPCDAWVIEVGLGGRLDATNILNPSVSVITNIAFDHQEWLGNSLNKIATEKAGIISYNSPCVSAASNVKEAINLVASKKSAKVLSIGDDYSIKESEKTFEWRGDKKVINGIKIPENWATGEKSNLATALMSLEVCGKDYLPSTEETNEIVRNFRIPGRFEIIEKDVPWILDVAHNANAAKNFLQRLESLKLGNNNIMILSLMKDKNIKDFVDVFRNYVSKWIVCGMRSPRSLTGEQMKNLLKRNENVDISAFEYPEEAFDYSQSIYEDYESVIVTGSFEIVGPAINWLEKNK